jgi:hypothetical protein
MVTGGPSAPGAPQGNARRDFALAIAQNIGSHKGLGGDRPRRAPQQPPRRPPGRRRPGGAAAAAADTAAPGAPEGSYVFPVAGQHGFTDTWGAPRARHGGHHEGVDIFAPAAHPVVAIQDGVVTKMQAARRAIGGNRVWINGKFFYAHLSTSSRRGQAGRAREGRHRLGYVGATGDAKGTPTAPAFRVVAGRLAGRLVGRPVQAPHRALGPLNDVRAEVNMGVVGGVTRIGQGAVTIAGAGLFHNVDVSTLLVVAGVVIWALATWRKDSRDVLRRQNEDLADRNTTLEAEKVRLEAALAAANDRPNIDKLELMERHDLHAQSATRPSSTASRTSASPRRTPRPSACGRRPARRE